MEQQAEITVIYGPNASGKTQYVERLRRQLASDSVRYLAFSDAYGAATDRAYYLQLRWNQHDIDEETPTVGSQLMRAYALTGDDTPERQQLLDHLCQVFNLQPLLDKYVILLSSGELRKFQLIKTLLANPKTLILDNPFIGLDAQAREQLNDLLPQLAESQKIHLYLVVSRQSDIPNYATKVLNIESEGSGVTKDSFVPTVCFPTSLKVSSSSSTVIDMHKVSIRYGERTILKNLDWCVKKGEHWAVSGQNGSGKSTLLSLVCADNPQS